MKNKIRLILFVLAIFGPILLISQPSPNANGPGGGTHGLPAGGENKEAPVNGGAVLIVLMAIGLGAKRQLTHPEKE